MTEGRYQVDRRVLRSVLLTSQSTHITYEAAFSSYTLLPDSATAHFADGTSVRGSLIVGADGTRSKVAAQLIGESAAPLDLGRRIIYGKTPLHPIETEIHPTLRQGTSFVNGSVDGHTVLSVLEAMRFTHPGAPENYMFWTLSTSRDVFGDEDAAARLGPDGDAAAKLALRITAHWDPHIRVIFEQQTADQTAVLPMSSSNPDGPPAWPTERRVTVLGDAVHGMPPTGGQGANSAMHDAALLGAALGGSAERDGWRTETIRAYEEAMRYNIGDVVGLACIGVKHLLA